MPGQIIRPQDLGQISDCELLLIKTGFEKFRYQSLFWKNSPGLSHEVAFMLRKRCPSLKAVGMDFISVGNIKHKEMGKMAHKAFLKNNILLIEDMKLSGLLIRAPDIVIVAPLIVSKADAAPCTIIAIYN
jgi:kynurenine formamidase